MTRRILPRGICSLFLLFMLLSLPQGGLLLCQTLEDAVRHFQAGRLDRAKRILQDQADEPADEPEILFYLGRVEERGDLSARYFQSITERCPDWAKSAEAGLLACKYEFCRDMNLTTIERAERLREEYMESEVTPALLWISGCSFLAIEQADSALLRFGQILRSFSGSSWAQWAQLGRGDCFFANQDYHQAVTEYDKILDVNRYSQAFPFALSGLARSFARLEDPERALLYHNLLRERYPRSVESIQNLIETGRPPTGVRGADQAERMAGVRYTIQLGVFGERQNALRLRSQFEEQGYSVRIRSKTIGGKEYRSVQLGSFVSYQEALRVKEELESQTGESYRIVIR
ncbi:MAG: SPOR domain-containing protein [Candidatus Zixiibacteriota bacterium]|nr:MAG: SPOR domain-containing protein [candidate division Zixibacteria bacterium]